jgi:hypothetical protein
VHTIDTIFYPNLKMSDLSREIGIILKEDPNAVEGVRRLLRNTKSKQKDVNTRDLNAAHHIPGYKFIRRDTTIRLERRGPFEPAQVVERSVDTPSSSDWLNGQNTLRPLAPNRIQLKSPLNIGGMYSPQGVRQSTYTLNADEDYADGDPDDNTNDSNMDWSRWRPTRSDKTSPQGHRVDETETRRRAPKSPREASSEVRPQPLREVSSEPTLSAEALPKARPSPPPKVLSIKEQIDSLAKTQALSMADGISKSLQTTLDRAVNAQALNPQWG